MVDLLMQYVIASTELYGIVPREKVLEIYLSQNDEKLNPLAFDVYVNKNEKILFKYHVHFHQHYFVHESIIDFGEFEIEMMKKQNKPYFVPNKTELLKYQDEFYVEDSKQYRKLKKFIKEKIFPDDHEKALELAEEAALMLRMESSIKEVMGVFDHFGVIFNSEKDVQDFVPILTDLANNVRIWSNNGHKPSELSRSNQQGLRRQNENRESNLSVIQGGRSNKVGRNDPCPCGSGKKYKHCCLNK